MHDTVRKYTKYKVQREAFLLDVQFHVKGIFKTCTGLGDGLRDRVLVSMRPEVQPAVPPKQL
jgi:hypothetical protein